MIILIPAYEPDQRLVSVLEAIRSARPEQLVLVVDDGSGPAYAAIFAAARATGADVIAHDSNRGKGTALKTGFAYIEQHHRGRDVVCADCDGQHSIVDILRVAEALRSGESGVVLGARQFAGEVPARSRFGNTVTRVVFDLLTGRRLQDTQTGLRGYPARLVPWLQSVPGERFEYELDVLLTAEKEHIHFQEVPIETIYLDHNESSHFRTIRDSIRVYVPVVKFSLSSLAAFGIDATLFFLLMATTGQLLLSVIAARLVSAAVNFRVNRKLVFRGDKAHRRAAWRYASLVVAIMGANYLLLWLLTVALPVPLLPAKLLTDLALFTVSYQVQRRLVFRSAEPLDDGTGRPAGATPRWPTSTTTHPPTAGTASSSPPRAATAARPQ